MRYLGIDFGTRKIGLSLSDEEGRMAFPFGVLAVSDSLAEEVIAIVGAEKVGAIVIGESRNFKGEENLLMKKVHAFKKLLSERISIPLYFEAETLTSKEAERIQGHVQDLDASAATLILQSFLEKQKNILKNKEINNMQETNKISIDDFKKVHMIVGKIQEVERIPDTDKLLKLTVDLGEAMSRQIVSGIAPFFPDIDVLRGKKCVFVANLAPRTIRSFVSNGMILAAHTENDTFALIVPEADMPVGTRIG